MNCFCSRCLWTQLGGNTSPSGETHQIWAEPVDRCLYVALAYTVLGQISGTHNTSLSVGDVALVWDLSVCVFPDATLSLTLHSSRTMTTFVNTLELRLHRARDMLTMCHTTTEIHSMSQKKQSKESPTPFYTTPWDLTVETKWTVWRQWGVCCGHLSKRKHCLSVWGGEVCSDWRTISLFALYIKKIKRPKQNNKTSNPNVLGLDFWTLKSWSCTRLCLMQQVLLGFNAETINVILNSRNA